MNKPKICVYAICKNERAAIPRWYASMAEADGVYVLDTGSVDGSDALLAQLGAVVERRVIEPWRFDVARELSLAMVPEDADLCVCTDQDEYFEPGWRARLDALWIGRPTRVGYTYIWNQLADGSDGYQFIADKIHGRQGYHWRHPVHEVITPDDPAAQRRMVDPGIRLIHRGDPEKSRAQYLPLLELSVSEEPEDDRNLHYLGREYMFHGRWDDCIAALERHLKLPSAIWEPERCASMRYIARAWQAKGMPDTARRWLLRAAAEAPHLREPWVELAELELTRENWAAAYHCAQEALSITRRDLSYTSDPRCWGSLPEDLAAVSGYWLGLRENALAHAERALALEPDNDRLRENVRLIRAGTEQM